MTALHAPMPDLTDESVSREPLGFSSPVLTSTFQPSWLPSAPVIRPRLLDRLSTGVREKPLTLLSASAGAGKTVLAASWVEAHPVPWPVAWLSIDEACDRPELFWPYVLESLARAGVTLTAISADDLCESDFSSFITHLAADVLERPLPIVLVLDSSDHMLSRETTAGLDFLIRHAWPQFRLVMCGRADPRLPLHRYRLTDSITELRRDALAFTIEETRALLAHLDVPVSKDIATSLTEQTEGWAAGLQLAAASLRQGTHPQCLIDSLTQQDGSVAEYLFAEVLDAQPPRVRQLLLRTSVTPQLWPGLVDALTDRTDGRRTLASLVRANAFVERCPDSSGGYRVHSLFRELLLAQLSYESEEDMPELHRRCAGWYAEAGQHVTAVDHAVASGDWTYAAELLVDAYAVASLLAIDTSPFSSVMESLPTDVVGAEAAVLRAAWDLRRGHAVSAVDTERLAELFADGAGSVALRISAAVVHSAMAAIDHNDSNGTYGLDAAERAQALLGQLPEHHGSRAALSAVVLVSRATALLYGHGDDAAAQALGAALAASNTAGSARLQRACLGELALLEALRGRLCRATEFGRRAEGLAEESGVPRDQRTTAPALALAWVHSEEYHDAEGRRWAVRAEESAKDVDIPLAQPLLAVLQARLLRSRHDFASAATVIEPFVADTDLRASVRERVVLQAADLHLMQMQPELAMAILDLLPDPHGPRAEVIRGRAVALGARPQSVPRDVTQDAETPLDARVDGLIHQACTHLDRNDISRGVLAAKAALQIAEPERMRRPFIDSSTQLRKLLRVNPELRAAATWLSPSSRMMVEPSAPRVEQQRAAETTPPPELVLIESLSEREIEVLRHLSELLSTEEIGAAMFVSVNTVRTHVRSILRKLAVTRRNEAVRRARELALV
jgi:LuxR family transcriptional regulator, maltose regulon positive regulatory protein